MSFLIAAESDMVSHIPVISAVEGIELIITASSSIDPDMVVRGTLFFRQIGKNEYISQPMIRSGDCYKAEISAKYVIGKAIEYYIALYISDGNVITSPAQNASSLPHIVVVAPAKQGWFEALYPEGGSVIEERRPEITASFIDSVEPDDEIKIRLDGEDITQECEITEFFFTYIPLKDLSVGIHSITLSNLSKFGMSGSWHFLVKGKKPVFQDFSGTMSLTWQYANSDSESAYMLYKKGASFGILGQLGGKIFDQQFDGWINRSALYGADIADFGLGFYSDKCTINAGDIFPSLSKLTLDSMPAVGAEISIKPNERLALQIIGAESRLYDDDRDKFLFDLLNSKFAALQFSVSPIKERWEVNSSYIYARNNARISPEEPELSLSMEKENGIVSFGTKLNLPAQFVFQTEWARSENKTNYEEFGIDTDIDQAFFAGISKRIKVLSLEAFYLDIGNKFISEVNPFLEIGRKGIGFSGKYSHGKGISIQGEYTRHYQEADFDTQMRANINIFPSGFPSLNLGFYQQRLPYAQYDVNGSSVGSSYKFWKFELWASGSWSNSKSRRDNTERSVFSSSSKVRFRLTSKTAVNGYYFQFWNYKSDILSSLQKQLSFELQQKIGKKHSANIGLKTIKFADEENKNNSYVENVLIIKYQYSF